MSLNVIVVKGVKLHLLEVLELNLTNTRFTHCKQGCLALRLNNTSVCVEIWTEI